MTKEDRKKLLAAMIKSEVIKEIYDDYIIKEIPFETWVENTMDRVLEPITL